MALLIARRMADERLRRGGGTGPRAPVPGELRSPYLQACVSGTQVGWLPWTQQ
jgi:hypothetical protein